MGNILSIKKCLFAVVAFYLVAGAWAADDLTGTLKKIKDAGSISVGHRESSIPFSYYDDKNQVVGYSQDLVMMVVEAVKKKLNMPNLQVKLIPVTSQNRIPLVQNGTIDIESGSNQPITARRTASALTLRAGSSGSPTMGNLSALVTTL